jgi:hypothetical protein
VRAPSFLRRAPDRQGRPGALDRARRWSATVIWMRSFLAQRHVGRRTQQLPSVFRRNEALERGAGRWQRLWLSHLLLRCLRPLHLGKMAAGAGRPAANGAAGEPFGIVACAVPGHAAPRGEDTGQPVITSGFVRALSRRTPKAICGLAALQRYALAGRDPAWRLSRSAARLMISALIRLSRDRHDLRLIYLVYFAYV